MKIVIIGGVAGGMSAATRLRRLNEDAEIVVFERSGHVSFANCGLPYHVGGVIEERRDLLLQTPASLGRRFGIDVRVNHEVTAIDRAAHQVQVTDLMSGQASVMDYDVLVLSPGGRPVRPPIPGLDRALSLRDVEGTDALVAATQGAQSAAVIGAGFIGIEMTENLTRRGLQVTLIEATDQVMAPLDPEMAGIVHDSIRNAGVNLILGESVTSVEPTTVTLTNGEQVPADLVVAAIGVRPEVRLALDADLVVGERGGITVDDHLRTNDPAIYAIGDVVEKIDGLDGSAGLVPLANTANRQGRVVADIISGRAGADRPVLGTAIVEIFGLAVAATGWNEKRLRAAGRAYRAIHTHPGSHAGYYPGAATMSLKLLVDPESDAILGAQAVGHDGVDKRIDIIATAITGRITASALADLELAYAPQFGSAKDPVNMLGYVNRNMAEGLIDTLQWDELADAQATGAALIDVRTTAEFDRGTIPGAINVPLDDLRARMADVPAGDLVVTCQVGLRGYLATRILNQLGRPARNLDGGYRTWLHSPASADLVVTR
ncbi:MAG: FAD-dependent oxidoreductase [Nostocoides sp.]